MIHLIKKRKWFLEPTTQRILFAIALIALSSLYHGHSTHPLQDCPHEYYGVPGEVYTQQCSGQWQINFLGIIANIFIWYLIACVIRFPYEKMKFGI
jgi:hypothetical protein